MTSQPRTVVKPPFTRETAIAKVRAAEDAWNSRERPVSMMFESMPVTVVSFGQHRDQGPSMTPGYLRSPESLHEAHSIQAN